MTKTIFPTLAIPLSVAVFAAACGNDDDDSMRFQVQVENISPVYDFTGSGVFDTPMGAQATMVTANGTATRQAIRLLRPYVIAAERLFTRFSSMPRGMASVLKSIPVQYRIGMYSCDPPMPSMEKTKAITKKMGTDR